MSFTAVSMPSRSMLRPDSSQESSEDHIKETGKENNGTSKTMNDDEDSKTRDRQDSSTASNAPLVPINNQQQTAPGDISRRPSDRLRHPFRNPGSKGKKTASPSEPTPPATNPWAIDRQPPDENHDKLSPINRPSSELPFEKLATPFYLRPFSALERRDTVLPKEKASAIPVPVESRRVSDNYRSTSSSYPSQGMRTPDLLNSPPGTIRNRHFFSIGRYSKPNRLSELFSTPSSTKAELDSTEGYRQPLEAVVVDDQPESLPSSVTDGPKPVGSDTDDAKADESKPEGPQTVNSAHEIDRTAVLDPIQDPVHINPVASQSTDTIVRSSSDLPAVPRGFPTEEVSQVDGTTSKPEPVDPSPQQPTVLSKRSLSQLTQQRPADEDDSGSWVESFSSHHVPVLLSRTSTQKNMPLSGAADELLSGVPSSRKPTVAVRFSRRVRKVKFAKWLAKRLRRVGVGRRRQKPARAGLELTEANLKRIERADRVVNGKIRKRKYNNYNGDGVMVKHADLLRMLGEVERTGVDAGDGKDAPVGQTDAVGKQAGEGRAGIVMLPSGRVSDAPGKETAAAAAAKHDTIGRRAAAWFKEQTGSVRESVDLTRFLLREMKCEMKTAV